MIKRAKYLICLKSDLNVGQELWYISGNIIGKYLKMKTTTCLTNCDSSMSTALINLPVEQLILAIEELIMGNTEDVLLGINQVFAKSSNLSILIRKILNDNSAFAQVVDESYYHENGFHKIVLLAGKHFKLRLHHFGSASKIPMENIHDHRWAFASTILSGSLHMTLFQEHETEGEKLIHYKYNADKVNGCYSTDHCGLKRLKVVDSITLCTGQQYLMTSKDLHKITNKRGQESFTLILTGRPENSKCNLYSKREIKDDQKVTLKYDERILKKMLEQLSEKIFPIIN